MFHVLQTTLPRRQWRRLYEYDISIDVFQSTLPRREWRNYHLYTYKCFTYFNPHSHAGSDLANTLNWLVTIISIHTPTQGVTMIRYTLRVRFLFQSTLPRREWQPQHWRTLYEDGFQSTLPRREWHRRFPLFFRHFYFNPHSHAGSDNQQDL